MSRVGDKIKAARCKGGLSAKGFAKKLGVSESFINDIESGRKIINEDMIKKIEKVFNVDLSDNIFEDEESLDEPVENLKSFQKQSEPVNKQWEDAFSNIIKKIPVCDVNFREIFDYKYLPIIDKKVEGYNSDKIIYITVPDDSMRGFRMKKGDLALLYKNSEIISGGIFLIDVKGKRYIRQIKRLDSNKLLLISNLNDIKTEMFGTHEISVVGRCVRLEVEL